MNPDAPTDGQHRRPGSEQVERLLQPHRQEAISDRSNTGNAGVPPQTGAHFFPRPRSRLAPRTRSSSLRVAPVLHSVKADVVPTDLDDPLSTGHGVVVPFGVCRPRRRIRLVKSSWAYRSW